MHTANFVHLAHNLGHSLSLRLSHEMQLNPTLAHASVLNESLFASAVCRPSEGPLTAACAYGCTVVYSEVHVSALISDISLKPLNTDLNVKILFQSLCKREYITFDSHKK
jgi:hypothetical protein